MHQWKLTLHFKMMNKFLISSKKNSRLVSLLYAIYAIKYTIKKIILYMEWIENTRYDETLKIIILKYISLKENSPAVKYPTDLGKSANIKQVWKLAVQLSLFSIWKWNSEFQSFLNNHTSLWDLDLFKAFWTIFTSWSTNFNFCLKLMPCTVKLRNYQILIFFQSPLFCDFEEISDHKLRFNLEVYSKVYSLLYFWKSSLWN